ncbi:MAG: TIGR04086 family membrane protein [Clostridia bacterium]|nr:TIGR04086 family membrane protein [Clostridia bacterium]
MQEKNKSNRKEETKFPLIPLAVSAVISSVIYFIIIALLTVVVLNTSVSNALYLPGAIFAGALSGLICGFTAARILKEKGLFWGAICGLIQSLLCSIVIFILNKGTAGNGIFILIAVIVAFSAIGGISAVNLKKKIKY